MKRHAGINPAAYPYEDCSARKVSDYVTKKYGIDRNYFADPRHLEYGGLKGKDLEAYRDFFEIYGKVTEGCYKQGNCKCT